MNSVDIGVWCEVVFGGITAVGVLFNMQQVVSAKHAAIAASKEAKTSADEAAHHAILASRATAATNSVISSMAADNAQANLVITAMAGDVKELAVNTNSIQDKLNQVTREAGEAAGEKQGILIGRAQVLATAMIPEVLAIDPEDTKNANR